MELRIIMEQFLNKLTNYCKGENIYWQTTNSIVVSIKIDPADKLRILLLTDGIKNSYCSFNIMGLSLAWYEEEGVWRAFENTEGQFRLEV